MALLEDIPKHIRLEGDNILYDGMRLASMEAVLELFKLDKVCL